MTRIFLILVTIVAGVSFGPWPTEATVPFMQITIENGSPYFVPKSVTVSSQMAIRWDNPTPTEHTITHNGCLEDGAPCVFDSGMVLPNGTFTIPSLAPGRYPYICRIHPIMHGVITVTEAPVAPSQL
jgi:plastocyanin